MCEEALAALGIPGDVHPASRLNIMPGCPVMDLKDEYEHNVREAQRQSQNSRNEHDRASQERRGNPRLQAEKWRNSLGYRRAMSAFEAINRDRGGHGDSYNAFRGNFTLMRGSLRDTYPALRTSQWIAWQLLECVTIFAA